MAILTFCAFIISPLPAIYLYFTGNWYSLLHSYSIGMLFGIVGYTYLMNALIMSSRLTLLDRLAGHVSVIRTHAVISAEALLFSITHFGFKQIHLDTPTQQTIFGFLALMLFVIASLVAILTMGGISFFGKKFFVGRLNYNLMKLLHNCAVIAALFVAIHTFLADSTAETKFRQQYMVIYSLVALLLYVRFKIIRPLLSWLKDWRVIEVSKLAPNITEIKIVSSKNKSVIHKPGQFGYFRFLHKGFCEEHPFTISSAPGSKELVLRIKNLGDFTTTISKIPLGTQSIIDAPYGKFVPVKKGANVLLFAGGIGITPFLSMIDHFSNIGFSYPVTLVWSCRDEVDFFASEKLLELQNREKLFRFIQVYSSISRVDISMISSLVQDGNLNFTYAYICGPDAFMRSVFNILKNVKVKSKNIRSEKFI